MARKRASGAEDRGKIERDILDQLERNGTIGDYYTDLAKDYMSLWEVKRDLYEDIKKRGAKVDRLDSRGQRQTSNNESIEQALKVNTQMLKILDSLGIRPVEGESARDGGDCDL